MKILVVDHNAVEPLGQSLYRTLSREADVSVRVVVPARWFNTYGTVRAEGLRIGERFEIVPLPVLLHTRTHRLIYRGIAAQLREFRPDVFYVNAEPENFQTLECALILGSRRRVPFVFSTWRNIDYPRGTYPYRFPALHALAERSVLRRADHAISFVPEAVEIFSRKGFNRMTWIPPDIDTSVFVPSKEPKHSGESVFSVGYVGRLHTLKGIDVLLDALAGLPVEFRLTIVGAGPEGVSLRERSRALGLADRVVWRDPVPRSSMPGVLNELDVLVLPSRTGTLWKEQFGRVLVEAMACGIPVVGSDSGAIPYVLGDAGIVVPEGNVRALEKALLGIRDDAQLRQAHVTRGIIRVSREFALPIIASRYLTLLRSLVT